MADIQKALQWMLDNRARGMQYSMSLRMHANYSDCSSAVLRALQHAGFAVPWIGNTESMFQWRGKLFTTISRADIRAGDVFVSGVPGGSANAYGHAGFALNATEAIHSTSVVNGIRISSNADSAVRAYSGAPVYWFRVIGSTAPSPNPTPNDPEDNNIYLDEEFVDHEYLQSVFGIKTETWTIDNVESQTDLKQKTMDRLNGQLDKYHETTATILELGIKDEDIELIELGNHYITNTEGRLMTHGSRRVIRQKDDFLEPYKTEITLGTKYSTLVDFLAERKM